MTAVDFEPLTVTVPLWEDPPGIFRLGNSRVLLELVISAFKRGETPEAIVRSYRTLQLADVYAVISYYLEHQSDIDSYLAARRIQTDPGPAELEGMGEQFRPWRSVVAWYCWRAVEVIPPG